MNNKESPATSTANRSPASLLHNNMNTSNSYKKSWACQLFLYDAFVDNKPEKYKCRLRLLASPCGAEEKALGTTVESASYISETGTTLYNSQVEATANGENTSSLISVESLLDLIWQKYDLDGDGCLNNVEIKKLVEDYASTSVSEEHCQEFLESIDDDGDALIDRMELSKFIESGIKLSKKARETYSRRGEFHKIVVDFFDGVDKVRQDMQTKGVYHIYVYTYKYRKYNFSLGIVFF